MKRYLRLCLVFVLSLALPLSGMAGVQAPADPCPMQVLGMKMMNDMGMDCCDDSKAPSEHSKSCKPGQECKTSGLLQTAVIKPFAPLHASPQTALIQRLMQREPAGLWRPPRVS